MEFSELWFIFIFLPLTMILYLLMPNLRSKNVFLLLASMVFYALVQPIFLILLLWLTLMNYALSMRVVEGKAVTAVAPIALTVGLLVLFKTLQVLPSIGTTGENMLSEMMLPLGISYVTFQLITYQVDIYRGKHAPADSLWELMLYVFLFPKVITGPIVRYADFGPQLHERSIGGEKLLRGLVRFSVGLCKKVLLADHCGDIITQLQGDGTGAGAWLCALLYMFRIYFEFSGCSDMAIGMGKMFGFDFCENFNLPYAATSITDFWRRWHMSLSSFFRDYVYIPLGGNRKGKLRQLLNMLIVWSLTGLWHGASANYLLWGLYFFVLLVIEKQLMPMLQKVYRPMCWALTSVLILFGWVIFFDQDLRSLFVFDQFMSATVLTHLRNSMLLLIACVIGCSALPKMVAQRFTNWTLNAESKVKQTVCALVLLALAAALLYLCTVSLIGATNAPDIYGGKLR